MENIAIIYGLYHPLTNELRYIGKTKEGLKKRYYRHLSPCYLKENTYKDKWIKALLKQGLKPDIKIIDIAYKENINFWEQYYISYFKSLGFNLTNLTIGGDGGQGQYWKNKKHSKKTKLKISKSKIGTIPWNKGKKGAQQGLSGKNNPMYEKKGKLHHFYGKKHSEKSKELQSIAKKDKYEKENNPNAKKIKIIDINSNKNYYFDYQKKAVEFLSTNPVTFSIYKKENKLFKGKYKIIELKKL